MKFITKLKGRAETRLTQTRLDYTGSITLSPDLMAKAGIEEGEQVHVLNKSNGQRIITYAIQGIEGQACLNGAAARCGLVGDEVIILTYELVEKE